MSSSHRLALATLLSVGTLVGHGLVYLLAGHHGGASGGHAYLGLLTPLLVPLALVALGWFGICGRRHSAPPLWVLAVGQMTLFVAQESAEHLALGHALADVATSPTMRWGAFVQLLVAVCMVLLIHLARAAGELLAGRPSAWRPGDTSRSSRWPRRATAANNSWRNSCAPTRGPPGHLVLA